MVRSSDRPLGRKELVEKEVLWRDEVDERMLWVHRINRVDTRASTPFGEEIAEVQRLSVRGGQRPWSPPAVVHNGGGSPDRRARRGTKPRAGLLAVPHARPRVRHGRGLWIHAPPRGGQSQNLQ